MAPKTNAVQSETGSLPVKVNLLHFRKNVSDLRLQLHQMRQLQVRASLHQSGPGPANHPLCVRVCVDDVCLCVLTL